MFHFCAIFFVLFGLAPMKDEYNNLKNTQNTVLRNENPSKTFKSLVFKIGILYIISIINIYQLFINF